MLCVRARPGWVYIVGAGPGDPGLLTVKARALLESCDCVLFDRLAAEDVLGFAPPSAERIDVGKVGYGCQVGQSEIHDLLVDRARRGRRVVRLKGGCPTVFGRLHEEVEALRCAGIRHEVVPGISSALAVPASAGIAVTERGRASSVAIVTGHACRPGRSPIASVAHADTVVILMGARRLSALTAELIALGRSPETPAAFVSEGASPRQRTLRATLGTLADAVGRAGLGAPAVIVVGEVAKAGFTVPPVGDASVETDILVESRL
jgi:uroporphyrin-III C-methyltransferase